MKTTLFPGRTYYQSSGLTNWGLFLPWLLVPFGAAALLACLMFWLFSVGHYYIIIVPAVAALAVAACVKSAVVKGHCRSRWIAAAAGAGAGALLYLGYYYCGMVYHLGPETARRPDLLPYYIRARMHLDVLRGTHDSSREDDSDRPGKANTWLNWGVFGFETVVVFAFTIGAALGRSRKPYCEVCRRWMTREVTHFEPAQADGLVEALRQGSPRALAGVCAQPVFATVPNTMLAAEYCPSITDGRTRDCPVYLSLKQVTKAAGSGPMLDPFESAQGKVLVRSLQCSPDEVAALGARFKVFESLAGRAAVAALRPDDAAAAPPAAAAGAVAEIRPVESDLAGRVLTKRHAIVGNLYAFSALLLLFAAIGLAAWGGITAFPDKNSKRTVSPELKAAGVTGLVLGGVLFVGTAVFFLVNPTWLGNRYLLKVVRREFARRANSVVDQNDPEALFVEIVPKLNWGKLSFETARDVGYLRVDKSRRQVLFEGDKERWRIPAAAITHCEVEFFVEGQGTHAATKIFYVVLRARHPTEFWEAPIRERQGTGLFRSGARKKSALRLCAAIREIQEMAR